MYAIAFIAVGALALAWAVFPLIPALYRLAIAWATVLVLLLSRWAWPRPAKFAVVSFAVAFLAFAIDPVIAFAQAAATAPGDVPAAPWVALLKPYIDTLVTALVGAALTWGAARLQQWSGIQMQNAAVERLKSGVATYAGAEVAAAEDNLAGRSISVGSPIVANIINKVGQRMPDVLAASKVDPAGVQQIVLGEIGKLQAAASPVPAPVVVATAAPAAPVAGVR